MGFYWNWSNGISLLWKEGVLDKGIGER